MVLKMVIDMLLNGCKGIAANGQGLCVRAVIEKLKFKYRTNDK